MAAGSRRIVSALAPGPMMSRPSPLTSGKPLRREIVPVTPAPTNAMVSPPTFALESMTACRKLPAPLLEDSSRQKWLGLLDLRAAGRLGGRGSKLPIAFVAGDCERFEF